MFCLPNLVLPVTECDALKQMCLISRAEMRIHFGQCLPFNASFLLLSSRREAFILEYVDVRCQQFDGGVWCSEMLSLPLFLFLKAEASKWAQILFYTSVPPRRGAESEDGTTQVVKPYRLNAFEMRRLWNCNVSIRRMAITQSTQRRAELHYSAWCICQNVNPSRSGSSRYASLHGPGDPLRAPLWLCPLTHRHFLALSSHLKTPPGAIWLPFSVATWHLQGYGHVLVWSNLHDGCQLPSACPD